jgi:Cdc6-like AAA superfamily ATPase
MYDSLSKSYLCVLIQSFNITSRQHYSKPFDFQSSTSLSLLPSEPKIFHGRQSELADIFKLFNQETPRIAILGAGGMGKTSLARAVLHHPDISTKFGQYRYFVACDSAATEVELAALIGAHLGLTPEKVLTQQVVQHLLSSPRCLLILDSLETLWECAESRGHVEEFLSLLTNLDHLALMVGGDSYLSYGLLIPN